MEQEQILEAQEAESLAAEHDAEVDAECVEMYEEVVQDIQSLVTEFSEIIKKHPDLIDRNFSIYYQHGRIGYMDLDAFAKSMNLEKVVNTEEQNDVDKIEE